ncbi:molybdopterin-dependent oxidoreductase [Candidatus Poribacteria bacterium]|nr:molybdopterin-dependent oxidoreductase [Candidatus Poribacteria bacterium]
MTKKFTHCGICLAACGLELEVEQNRIVSLRSDSEHPLTRGFVCAKGLAGLEMTTDPLRVLHPYERIGSEWRRIAWDEANEKISQRLREIISKHGPQSVAMYYGAGNPTSSINYMMADGFVRALGSDRMYNVLTLEFTNRYLVMEKMYGRQFFVTQPDIENTHCLLIFGSNPMVSIDHPGIIASLKALKERGGKLIVVDPRRTETARMADIHARIIPGTDLFMLEAMYSRIFAHKLHNSPFLEKNCSGHEFFEKRTWPVTLDDAERICGVPAKLIARITEEFTRAKSACAVAKLGINTSSNGTLTYWLVEALNAITGNVDRPGGLIFNPGILDLNLLSRMAAGRKQRKSRVGGFPYLTGSYPASVLPAEILSDAPDRIRALIVDAGDPSLVFPNSQKFEKAAKRLELIVSIDMYMNETAQVSHFVLPAANFFEKDDLYVTFPDHFAQKFAQWSHKVVEPPDEARAEWEIFRDLSRRIGVPILNQWPLDIMFRIGELAGKTMGQPKKFAFNPKNYYKMLLGMMGKVKFSELMSNPHGVSAGSIKFGAALRKLATRSRKIELAPADFVREIEKIALPPNTPPDLPFTLITGERSPHTKNTNLRGLKSLTSRQSENFARINPNDAASQSIRDGDTIEISTSSGALRIKAKVDDTMRGGVVSIGHGWGRKLAHPESRDMTAEHGVNVNLLTDDSRLDALTGMPVYNSIPCSILKCDK